MAATINLANCPRLAIARLVLPEKRLRRLNCLLTMGLATLIRNCVVTIIAAGPTHQSYFQSDSDASGENSKYSSSDSAPLDRDSPSMERTQTDGGAHGWDDTPPGASLKDY